MNNVRVFFTGSRMRFVLDLFLPPPSEHYDSSENGDGNCNYGTPLSEISGQFPGYDFSLVEEEEWWTTDETHEHVG